jgi:hypothetical protein
VESHTLLASTVSAATTTGLTLTTSTGTVAAHVRPNGQLDVPQDLVCGRDIYCASISVGAGGIISDDLTLSRNLVVPARLTCANILASSLTATSTAGVAILQKDGLLAFTCNDNRSCTTYGGLEVQGNLGCTVLVTNDFRADSASFVKCQDDMFMEKNLHVQGNLTVSGSSPSPFWAAGSCDSAGGILATRGQTGFNAGLQGAGIYWIEFNEPHPSGNGNYLIICACITGRTWGGFGTVGYERSTALGFWLVVRNASSVKFSSEFTFTVLA